MKNVWIIEGVYGDTREKFGGAETEPLARSCAAELEKTRAYEYVEVSRVCIYDNADGYVVWWSHEYPDYLQEI